MIFWFEPTRFEDKTIPTTMATLPGPSLATKRPKMIELRKYKSFFVGGQSSTTVWFLLLVAEQLV